MVETGGVPALHDLVACLQDEHVEPDAEVGGDHVHEAEARDELAFIYVHLLVEEYEVHLDEDEKHLLGRACTIIHLFHHLMMRRLNNYVLHSYVMSHSKVTLYKVITGERFSQSLQHGSKNREEVLAVGVLAQVLLEEHANLDA